MYEELTKYYEQLVDLKDEMFGMMKDYEERIEKLHDDFYEYVQGVKTFEENEGFR